VEPDLHPVVGRMRALSARADAPGTAVTAAELEAALGEGYARALAAEASSAQAPDPDAVALEVAELRIELRRLRRHFERLTAAERR